MTKKSISAKKSEWIVLILFSVCYIFVTIFHEPWFDEAQAWQIAKCSSVKDILLVIPHYEGHPPLWHLILAIPAKMGIPFEIGLKSIGFIITITSIILILFVSPIPRIVKLLLPFNYFIFYQYGIVVRPYCLMLLLLLVIAIIFPVKKEHPFWFCGSLGLLCLTSAYGILMAGGIAICVLWDMIMEKGIRQFAKSFFHNKQVLALFLLLIFAIILIIEIIPAADCDVTTANPTNALWQRILYALLIMPGESLLYTSPWFSTEGELLQYSVFEPYPFIGYCFIGILLWLCIFCLSGKKLFKYYIVPYIFFTTFGAYKYLGIHHLGISLLLLIFEIWISAKNNSLGHGWNILISKIMATPKEKQILGSMGKLVLLGCLLIPAYWNIKSSILDFQTNYSSGRAVSKFLKENGLDKKQILSGWETEGYEQLSVYSYKDIDTNALGGVSTYLAYFNHNILSNVYYGDDNRAFYQYKHLSDAENAKNLAYWRTLDYPDVLLGRADVDTLFDKKITLKDNYTLVYTVEYGCVWKGNQSISLDGIYLRNDLLDEYNLKEVSTAGFELKITESMISAYKKGELSIEDLADQAIKSYVGY